MKKDIICFSGWAQKANSLETLFLDFKAKYNIINFDYSKFDNFDDFVAEVKKLNSNSFIAAGWSLGGQLCCRLIAQKIINPQYLILIGAPFQFVKSPIISAAMPQNAFNEFRHNFISNPDKTLKKFAILMNINDKNAKELADNLDINEENHHKLAFWLDELERFSCFDINFENFPQSLIFHGALDMVVHQSQAILFSQKIPHAKLEIISGCGHTPHIANKDELISKIRLLPFNN